MSKTRVRLTPEEMSNQWNRNIKNATERIRLGIDRVEEAPSKKAIAKKDKMKQNLMRSLDDGTWEKQLGKVSLEDWKTKFSSKVSRIASGADDAMDKRRAFDTWLAGRLNTVLPKIASMPDLTIDDSIARSAALIRAMSENKYRS